MEPYAGWMFLATGVVLIVGAVADWDWFMLGGRHASFAEVHDRHEVRIFCVVAGTALAIYGLAMLLEFVPVPERFR